MANTSTGNNNWDNKELGALWKKQKQSSGENYLTGTFNFKNLGSDFPDKDVPVVVFQNKRKTKDTHPDLRVYLSEKSTGAQRKQAPANTTRQPRQTAPATPAQDANELI